MNFDKAKIYQISTRVAGALTALPQPSISNGRYCGMLPKAKEARQGWIIEPVEDGNDNTFYIRSWVLGHRYLTVVEFNNRTALLPKSNDDGQVWQIEESSGGRFVIRNKKSDYNNQLIAVSPDDGAAFGIYTDAQILDLYGPPQEPGYWDIEIDEIKDLAPLPKLKRLGGSYSFAPLDTGHYLSTNKLRRAVLLYLDYPDAVKFRREKQNKLDKQSGITTTKLPVESAIALGERLLGKNGEAIADFKRQSWGKFDLEIHDKAHLGWKLLPKESSKYPVLGPGVLLADVKKLFDPNNKSTPAKDGEEPYFPTDYVNFDAYDIFMYVHAKEIGDREPDGVFGYSHAGVTEVGKFVHFGSTARHHSHVLTVHEIAHVLGLPDLYPKAGPNLKHPKEFTEAKVGHAVGCWSVMGDLQRSRTFLGIERNHLNWMDNSRALNATKELKQAAKQFSEDQQDAYISFDLTPLEADNGLSMVTVELDKNFKMFVAEIGQPVYSAKLEASGVVTRSDETSGEKGVLLYTVDSRTDSWQQPIHTVPRVMNEGDVKRFGALHKGLFGDGDEGEYYDAESWVMVRFRVKELESGAFRINLARYDVHNLHRQRLYIVNRPRDFYRMRRWLGEHGLRLEDGGRIYEQYPSDKDMIIKLDASKDATKKQKLNLGHYALPAKTESLDLTVKKIDLKKTKEKTDKKRKKLEDSLGRELKKTDKFKPPKPVLVDFTPEDPNLLNVLKKFKKEFLAASG